MTTTDTENLRRAAAFFSAYAETAATGGLAVLTPTMDVIEANRVATSCLRAMNQLNDKQYQRDILRDVACEAGE